MAHGPMMLGCLVRRCSGLRKLNVIEPNCSNSCLGNVSRSFQLSIVCPERKKLIAIEKISRVARNGVVPRSDRTLPVELSSELSQQILHVFLSPHPTAKN